MAVHTGKEGIVKVGSSPAIIAEVRDWSLETTGETTESSSMSSTQANGGWRTMLPTLKTWSGKVSCWWDEADTNGQQVIDVGSVPALKLYPEGDGAGAVFYSGNAIVTGVNRQATLDGMVEVEFTFSGTGALTESTVGA